MRLLVEAFVALLIELPLIFISPISIWVVAVRPIVFNCPDVPDVVLPMLIFAVWDSKNLKAVVDETESIFEEIKLEIV